MGYIFEGTCYATEADATDAAFQGYSPSFLSGNPTLHTYLWRNSSGQWSIVQDSITNGVTTTQWTASPQTLTFSTCDTPTTPYESFQQGHELGWAVASVMILVFVIRRIYR